MLTQCIYTLIHSFETLHTFSVSLCAYLTPCLTTLQFKEYRVWGYGIREVDPPASNSDSKGYFGFRASGIIQDNGDYTRDFFKWV